MCVCVGLHVMYVHHLHGRARGGHQGTRAPDLITDGCETPGGCWELISGPLEEQAVLLAS